MHSFNKLITITIIILGCICATTIGVFVHGFDQITLVEKNVLKDMTLLINSYNILALSMLPTDKTAHNEFIKKVNIRDGTIYIDGKQLPLYSIIMYYVPVRRLYISDVIIITPQRAYILISSCLPSTNQNSALVDITKLSVILFERLRVHEFEIYTYTVGTRRIVLSSNVTKIGLNIERLFGRDILANNNKLIKIGYKVAVVHKDRYLPWVTILITKTIFSNMRTFLLVIIGLVLTFIILILYITATVERSIICIHDSILYGTPLIDCPLFCNIIDQITRKDEEYKKCLKTINSLRIVLKELHKLLYIVQQCIHANIKVLETYGMYETVRKKQSKQFEKTIKILQYAISLITKYIKSEKSVK